MGKNLHPYKNWIQNVAILLLSISAVTLFVWTYALSNRESRGYLTDLFSVGTAASGTAESLTNLSELPMPVLLAVTGKYGRSGNISLSTTDEAFSAPGTLLKEALGSAGLPETCKEQDFRTALNSISIYCDFRTDLPLSLLGGLIGAGDTPDASFSVRRILIAADTEVGVRLYLTDGASYDRYSTQVSRETLSKLVGDYQLGNASFAYELEAGAALDPYSLLLTGNPPSLSTLSAGSALEDPSLRLTELEFNPHTQSRYTEAGGTEVIRDGDRTLRLRPDGRILYESGGSSAVRISAAGDTPSAEEAVLGAYRLLSHLLNGRTDGASLALRSAAHSGNEWTLTFDYQIGGVPIVRSDGASAAAIQLTGPDVASLSLQIRQYVLTGESVSLLPLTQALAVAERNAGSELAICYEDTGTAAVSAAWLAIS